MATPEADPPEDEPCLTKGRRLFGRYVLVARCGKGASGVVWQARDELLDTSVAIKLIPAARASERLKAEVRQARRLSHPNLVRVYDYVEDSETAGIVMELVRGTSLAALSFARPHRRFPPAEVAGWLPQLAAALDHAHQEVGLVHCDLKPANLLLTPDGFLKVTDFGAARSRLDHESLHAGGTPGYMSPQQASGQPPSVADDIYSLGSTLHELLTGRLTSDGGDVPAAWAPVLAACLQRDPAGRPASAGQVAAEILGAETIRASATGRLRGIIAPRLRRAWLARLGVALVAAATLIGWALHRRAERGSIHPLIDYAAAAGEAPTFDPAAPLVDLPLAGDGRSRTLGGINGSVRNVRPVPDRYGLPARALRFTGAGAVTAVLPESTRFGSDSRWTISVWLRCEPALSGDRTIAEVSGEEIGSFILTVDEQAGKLTVAAGRRLHTASTCESVRLWSDARWHHLVVAGNRDRLWLWVDGLLEQTSENRGGPAPAPRRQSLFIGSRRTQSPSGFKGDLADFRLFRRLLTEGEIRRLSHAGPDDAVSPPPFLLSTGWYSESDDLEQALISEFGDGTELADWQAVRAACQQPGAALHHAQRLGLESGDNALVVRNGQRWHEPGRHYFLSRLDGQRPDYYLAHDEIDGHTLALGSWRTLSMRALARYPGAPLPAPHVATPVWQQNQQALTLPLRLPEAASILLLRHSVELKTGGNVQSSVVVTGSSPAATVTFAISTREGSFRLECARDGRVFWSRDLPGSFGRQEHCLVLGRQRVIWRVEKRSGVTPLAEEEIPMTNFPIDGVREVRWHSPVPLQEIQVRVE